MLGLKQTCAGVSPSVSSVATELNEKNRFKRQRESSNGVRSLLVFLLFAHVTIYPVIARRAGNLYVRWVEGIKERRRYRSQVAGCGPDAKVGT